MVTKEEINKVDEILSKYGKNISVETISFIKATLMEKLESDSSIVPTELMKYDRNYWSDKINGFILVKTEADKNKLFNLIVKQDDYWESYPEVIISIEKNGRPESERDLFRKSVYVGKTDIWDFDKLKSDAMKENVEFFTFQHYED